MSQTAALSPPVAPLPKRWTVDEYHRLANAGFLPGRYELIYGEIIEQMPSNPPHIFVLQTLGDWLQDAFGRLYVRMQVPIALPNGAHEPEPDAAVTKAPRQEYAARLPEPADVELIVEVSDTTLPYDLGRKATLYAQAGIQEYWVLDVNERRLFVHREPSETGYGAIETLAEGERVAPLAKPDASVLVATLLPPSQT